MAQPTAYKTAKTGGEREHSRSDAKTPEAADIAQVVEDDNWVLNNPEACAAIKRGLADVAAGRVYTRRSYAEYADVESED